MGFGGCVCGLSLSLGFFGVFLWWEVPLELEGTWSVGCNGGFDCDGVLLGLVSCSSCLGWLRCGGRRY